MSTYLEARAILRSAFKRVVGRSPSEDELSAGQAVADLETGYGRSGQFGKLAARGLFNWGALERGRNRDGTCPPGTAAGSDLGGVCFYVFPSDSGAAEAFLKTWAKPSTLSMANLGLERRAPHAIALDMYRHQYFTGFWRGLDGGPSQNPGITPSSTAEFQRRAPGQIKFTDTQAEADERNVGEYAQAIANAWRRASSSSRIPGPDLVTGSSGLGFFSWLFSLADRGRDAAVDHSHARITASFFSTGHRGGGGGRGGGGTARHPHPGSHHGPRGGRGPVFWGSGPGYWDEGLVLVPGLEDPQECQPGEVRITPDGTRWVCSPAHRWVQATRTGEILPPDPGTGVNPDLGPAKGGLDPSEPDILPKPQVDINVPVQVDKGAISADLPWLKGPLLALATVTGAAIVGVAGAGIWRLASGASHAHRGR